MNRLINNYKARIHNVVSGDTIEAMMDVGLYDYKFRKMRLADLDFGDRDRNPEQKERAEAARLALRGLLFHDPADDNTGRVVIVATNKPNRKGDARILAYIPARAKPMTHDELHCCIAGFNFLMVNRAMHRLAEKGFDLEYAEELITDFDCHDI